MLTLAPKAAFKTRDEARQELDKTRQALENQLKKLPKKPPRKVPQKVQNEITLQESQIQKFTKYLDKLDTLLEDRKKTLAESRNDPSFMQYSGLRTAAEKEANSIQKLETFIKGFRLDLDDSSQKLGQIKKAYGMEVTVGNEETFEGDTKRFRKIRQG